MAPSKKVLGQLYREYEREFAREEKMTKKFTEAVHKAIKDYMTEKHLWSDAFEEELPKKGGWQKYGDLVLFPETTFRHSIWRMADLKIWEIVAGVFKCKRIARTTGSVLDDEFRSPQIEILLPGNGSTYVEKTENRIKYGWDIVKSMYCIGNTSEKLRIAGWNLYDRVVVDMYAGIGYFTLPYLVHAKAKKVYAIEWNPASAEALRKNLTRNNVAGRCEVIEGDSHLVTPENVADHVNLGLLPDASHGYAAAVRALKRDTGGFLHIHGLCDAKFISEKIFGDVRLEQEKVLVDKTRAALCMWASFVRDEINDILLEQHGATWDSEPMCVLIIKSYGPYIYHMVFDLRCFPKKEEEKKDVRMEAGTSEGDIQTEKPGTSKGTSGMGGWEETTAKAAKSLGDWNWGATEEPERESVDKSMGLFREMEEERKKRPDIWADFTNLSLESIRQARESERTSFRSRKKTPE